MVGTDLQFAPLAGTSGPAFRLTSLHGGGAYDAQVNAVDAQGRYGPDVRGTVHLDYSMTSGDLSTPDVQLPTGETTRYAGRWQCATTSSQAPPPERPGGPQSPR